VIASHARGRALRGKDHRGSRTSIDYTPTPSDHEALASIGSVGRRYDNPLWEQLDSGLSSLEARLQEAVVTELAEALEPERMSRLSSHGRPMTLADAIALASREA
jgi:hypothetical protein